MTLDGNELTGDISVPKNDGEENYDDYNKVQKNVTLPAGEHILRFTVVGDWMDVDYFTFVKGKDATDPEPIGDGPVSLRETVRFDGMNASAYRVFDVAGNCLGRVEAATKSELSAKTRELVRNGGVYIVKPVNGGMGMRFMVTK